jgi:hypothetical protein
LVRLLFWSGSHSQNIATLLSGAKKNLLLEESNSIFKKTDRRATDSPVRDRLTTPKQTVRRSADARRSRGIGCGSSRSDEVFMHSRWIFDSLFGYRIW